MTYSKITYKELEELKLKDRTAFIINVNKTNDIEEYINSSLIVLSNMGFDINKFTKPRVISFKNKSYAILLLVRSNINSLNKQDKNILKYWINCMGNVDTLSQFLNKHI